MIFGRHKMQGGGALLLPRETADRDIGAASWPKCARCRRAVDAYGIQNENSTSIEIWAECRGIRLDPATGTAVWPEQRIHYPMKSSVWILKGPGWSPQRFTDIVRRQAFFSPDGDRQYTQTLTPDGVKRTWGAG
jgi:hypothetical protein